MAAFGKIFALTSAIFVIVVGAAIFSTKWHVREGFNAAPKSSVKSVANCDAANDDKITVLPAKQPGQYKIPGNFLTRKDRTGKPMCGGCKFTQSSPSKISMKCFCRKFAGNGQCGADSSTSIDLNITGVDVNDEGKLVIATQPIQ
jgi:hypothetical protein